MKIEVKNLTKHFKEKEILKDINISFYSGNIYCLSGPNGSGKSIFLNLLCGTVEPSSGEILLNGKNILKKNLFFNRRKQLVDNTNFSLTLTGYENLKMIAKKNKNITDEDILIALKKVNLIEYKDQRYCEYSFGMRQRLIIAKVLMEDPKIIILDDPFTGVDEPIKQYLIELLKFAKGRDRIVIISTNNDIDIKSVADVNYHFLDGKLLWS